MTMDALAEAVGVSKSVVHDWEKDVMVPKPPNLARLAASLEVDLERLYELAGYAVPRALPELGEYLRARFPNLSGRALTRIERAVGELVREEEAHVARPS